MFVGSRLTTRECSPINSVGTGIYSTLCRYRIVYIFKMTSSVNVNKTIYYLTNITDGGAARRTSCQNSICLSSPSQTWSAEVTLRDKFGSFLQRRNRSFHISSQQATSSLEKFLLQQRRRRPPPLRGVSLRKSLCVFTRFSVEGQLFPTFADKRRNWITLSKVCLLHQEDTPSADPSASKQPVWTKKNHKKEKKMKKISFVFGRFFSPGDSWAKVCHKFPLRAKM